MPALRSIHRRHLLHIKRLELSREPIQKHRGPNDIRHLPFSSLGDIISHGVVDHLHLPLLVLDDVALGVFGLVLDPVVVEPLDGVYVGQTQEGSSGCLEVGVELFDEGTGYWVFQKDVDRFADLGI